MGITIQKKYHLQNKTKTPSPAKVATATSIAKISYDKNFTKDTFLTHPSIIQFLTAMEANDTRLNIEPSILKEDIL